MVKLPAMRTSSLSVVECLSYYFQKDTNSHHDRRSASLNCWTNVQPNLPIEDSSIITSEVKSSVTKNVQHHLHSKRKIHRSEDADEKKLMTKSSSKNYSHHGPVRTVFLEPPKRHCPPITLLLDVDETLVHSTLEEKGPYDVKLEVQINGSMIDVYVKFRPFLKEFLDIVSELFEVVIFTASHSSYCNQLMDYVDPEGKLGHLRLSREHCTRHGDNYVKDLWQLGRPLERVALLDNSHSSSLFQPRNRIPISTWFDDPNDRALRDILPLLQKLAQADNVYDVVDEYKAGFH